MSPINAANFELDAPRPQGAGTTGRFIRGPLSLVWLAQAARLPGRALHVALWLLYRSGLQRSQTVKLAGTELFGVTRWACQRGLRQLEGAKLVVVERRTGKAPLVTLLGAAHVQRGVRPHNPARRETRP